MHKNIIRSFVIVALVAAGLTSPAWADPGDLDPAFDADGRVTTDFGVFSVDEGRAVGVQPDGKVVTVGFSTARIGPGTWGITRHDTDGSLDATFGDGGKVALDPSVVNGAANGVALQPDGKIVVVGDDRLDIAVARLAADGTLDASFGGDGVVTTSPGGTSIGTSVAIQPDDKIVVGGWSSSGGSRDFAVVRYNSDGTLDDSFGSDGVVTTDIDGTDTSWDLVLDSGKIVLAGGADPVSGPSRFALARYLSNGDLDATFAGDGVITTDFGVSSIAHGLALDASGRYVAAGVDGTGSSADIAVARYLNSGELDTDFDGDGMLIQDIGSSDSVDDVVVDTGGKIVVTGATGIAARDVLTVRYLSDGTPDPSFGTGGVVTTDLRGAGASDEAKAVALDGSDIVVAGSSFLGPSRDFVVVRYDSSGTFVPGFGTDGVVTTDIRGGNDIAHDVATDASNRIVAVGGVGPFWGIARYNTDGSPDPGFDGDGKSIVELEGEAKAVAIQPSDGKIVVVGSGTVVRLLDDGSLDAGFGTGGVTDPLCPCEDVVIQPDGKIVAAGSFFNPTTFDHDFAVARYNADGSPDDTFGEGSTGIRTVDFHSEDTTDVAWGVALQGSHIVVAGESDSKFGLTRLTPSGDVDPTFGTNGFVRTDVDPDPDATDGGRDVVIQPDGKIVVTGVEGSTGGNSGHRAVLRYTPDGALDPSFGAGGVSSTGDIRAIHPGERINPRVGNAIALGEAGTIVTAGRYGGCEGMGIVRMNVDGSLDPTFDDGLSNQQTIPGIVRIDGTCLGGFSAANGVAIDGDDQVVAVGDDGNFIETDFAVVRLDGAFEANPDFGDAPSPYPTTLAQDGPRHAPSPLYLGSRIDGEPDGQPHPSAIGDDIAGPLGVGGRDDEEAVIFGALTPGAMGDIDVLSSGEGFLNAWIDFDADGDWGDGGEQVFTDEPVTLGWNDLSVDVPAGATEGATFARFRLNSTGGLTTTGPAANGEVEDHVVTIGATLDFGDSADHPTTLAENGPRHTIGGEIMLGYAVDGEPDAVETPGADGDDLDGVDDESFTTDFGDRHTAGVFTFGNWQAGNAFESYGVTVSAPRAVEARLDAWVDFNADGDFDDPGEQIATDEVVHDGPAVCDPLPCGDNLKTMAVPADAHIGQTVARFRVSSTGGLSPTGPAPDGEVEDHLVTIEGLDYGDAPSTYSVLLAANGARHKMPSPLFLGSEIDGEPDGLLSSDALGDDLDGVDDEDGVTFTSALETHGMATVEVVSSGEGFVDAFVDLDGDGNWLTDDFFSPDIDPGDQVLTNEPVSAGTNVLSFPIPGDAQLGDTAARFRLSSAGNLGPTGQADDGEVEDYIVTIEQGTGPGCGDTVSGDVVLLQDLDCPGHGLIVGASGTTINLNGHVIRGQRDGHGIVAQAGTTGLVVRNGRIANFRHGVLFNGGGRVTLADLALVGNAVRGATVVADTVVVARVAAVANDRGGLSLRASGVAKVLNSSVSRNSGIGIVAIADRTVIRDSLLVRNDRHGILARATTRAITTANRARSNGRIGIVSRADRATIDGNAVIRNTALGISSTDAPTVRGSNTARGNRNGAPVQCRPTRLC